MTASTPPASPAFPVRTARLELRPHRADDADPLLRFYSRPDVARYLLEDPWNAADAEQRVAERLPRTDLNGAARAMALVIEHQGTVIGDVALWHTDEDSQMAEIGWVLDPDHGGKGFAAEAVAAILDLAFGHYRLHRVTAQMDARNTASAALAQRVGLRHEAHLRQNWWSKGEWTDTVIYAALATDRD